MSMLKPKFWKFNIWTNFQVNFRSMEFQVNWLFIFLYIMQIKHFTHDA